MMLRNCSVPFLAAFAVAVFEAAAGHHTPVSVVSAVLFAAATLSVLRVGRRVRTWASAKTLQVCYWIPAIDEVIRHGNTTPVRRQRRSRAMRRTP